MTAHLPSPLKNWKHSTAEKCVILLIKRVQQLNACSGITRILFEGNLSPVILPCNLFAVTQKWSNTVLWKEY